MDGTRAHKSRFTRGVTAFVLVLIATAALASCSDGTADRSASGDSSTTSNPVNTVPTGETILPPTTTTLSSSTTAPSTSTTSGVPSSSSTSTSTTVAGGTDSSTSTSTTIAPQVEPSVAALYPCATSVRLGPFEAIVEKDSPENCLLRNGLEWTSSKKVFVGGMEFRPVGNDAFFVFDPLNAHVHAVGYEVYGSIFGGELLIDNGVVDWSFQYSASQNSAPGWAMPIKSDEIKPSTIGRLPGLSGVSNYPRQPVNGFPDYSVVTDESVKQLVGAVPSLATSDVVFTLNQVGLTAIPAYTFSLPSQLIQRIADFEIEAAVTVQPVERKGSVGMALFGSLKLPSVFQGYFGELGIFWPVNGSVELEKLTVIIPEIDLGVVRIKGVDLKYSVGDKLWAGKVTVLFGEGADALGFGGTIRIQDGDLKEIGVNVMGLPLNIYGVASINSLGGNLRLDPFGIKASGQIGVGPYVPKIGNVAAIDGQIVIDTYELSIFGEGTIGSIMIGDLELKGMRVAEMKVAYYWDGIASISGKGELYLDTAKQWGVGVGLRGSANATDISLGGDATISLGVLKLGGSSAISTKGVIACGLFKGFWFDDARLGLSKDWAQPAWRLRGSDCNSKEYEVPVSPVDGSTQIGGGRNASGTDSGNEGFSVNVAEGQKMVTFAIDAANESATVTGPDGMTITVTGQEQSTQSDPANPRWVVFHEPGDTVSYVVVGKPAGGTWNITTSGPESPKVSASVVDAKSEPKAAATSTLKPTPVGAPLTALPAEPIGASENEAPVLEIVLVLLALSAGLAVTLVVLQRRHSATR